jgi:hypothetical protein
MEQSFRMSDTVRGLLIEGVSGAGKTKVLEAIQSHSGFRDLLQKGRIYYENETLGDILSDLKSRRMVPTLASERMDHVMHRLQRDSAGGHYGYVIERFHLTYYALLPDWDLYDEVDRQLFSLNCKVVVLLFEPERLNERSLERPDRRYEEWAQRIIGYFGSRQKALRAMAIYQERRNKALSLSKLPHMRIDTTAMNWPSHAEQIVRFWAEPFSKEPH